MAMSRKGGGRRSRAEGEQLVEEFEGSGLARKAFCARRLLSVHTLDYWRGKVREEAPTARPRFVELTADAAGAAGKGWEVELELGGGVMLRVRRGG